MSDFYSHSSDKFINVTPTDDVPLQYNGESTKCRGISIGVAGDLAIKNEQGVAVTIPAATLAIGVIHPISSDTIMTTNTTATSIVAWF